VQRRRHDRHAAVPRAGRTCAYFSNGSAATLRELVDFYDRRYTIGYSEQEKQDLVNFLGAL